MLQDRQAISGANVTLCPPAGFVPAAQYPGFEMRQAGGAIIVITMPVPYAAALAAYEPNALEGNGMSLLSREEVVLNGEKAALIHVAQYSGAILMHKALLLYPAGPEAVYLLNGCYPAYASDELARQIRRSLLSVQPRLEVNTDPFEGLTFQVTEHPQLRRAHCMANMLMLTRDGVFPSSRPGDPVMAAGSSIGGTPPAFERKAFAMQRLQAYPQLSGVTVDTTTPLLIDGMPGVELEGSAFDTEADTIIGIYQAMLFGDQVYYLITGFVGGKQRKTYMPIFRSVGRSLRRIKRAE